MRILQLQSSYIQPVSGLVTRHVYIYRLLFDFCVAKVSLIYIFFYVALDCKRLKTPISKSKKFCLCALKIMKYEFEIKV